jgi:hypothetical protein
MARHGSPRSGTARSRLCRKRQRDGLIRLTIELDEDRLCDWLVAGGVLSPLNTDDRCQVELALGRALTLLMMIDSER